MQTKSEESPFLNLRSKAGFAFDYETNNMKVEDKDDMQSKIYYFDQRSKTYSTFCLMNRNPQLSQFR
jgi:hypothetical protein